MGLDRQQDEIVGSGLPGAGRHRRAGHALLTVLLDKPHAVGGDGLEVAAAGDEGDLLAGQAQPRAQIAADRPGADDGDPHAGDRAEEASELGSTVMDFRLSP